MLNALIVHNNVLDETKNSIAIYHPGDDLLDVYLLIIMGLVAYKGAIIKNSKLRLNDFKVGELVEFDGRIAKYGGVSTDPATKIGKFRLGYSDKYNTYESIPLHFFSSVSKYSGIKTIPDAYEPDKTKKDAKDVLRLLLGFQGQQVGLSGYPAFLVSSERPHLINILKNIELNGKPFFEIFPSMKCTKGNRISLSRDVRKMAYMFYFVSGLSIADDVLESEPLVKTLFVDAQGKALRDISLAASIRNQYSIEDIYWLQSYSQLDLIEKLEKGLGFKIWIWDVNDFKGLTGFTNPGQSNTGSANSEYSGLVNKHNNVVPKLAAYEDVFVEIPYPQGISLESHKKIQMLLHGMFSKSNEYNNNDLLLFSVRAAGVANKIFQSPLSVSKLDEMAQGIGGKTLEEDIKLLRDSIETLRLSAVPENFDHDAAELVSLLDDSVTKFKEHYAKSVQAEALVVENKDRRVCILTKYPQTIDAIRNLVTPEIEKAEYGWLVPSVGYTDSITEAVGGYDIIIWTFKPSAKNLLMLEPRVGKNYLLVYPLQKQELERSFDMTRRLLSQYTSLTYRSGILKVPDQVLNNNLEALPQQKTDGIDNEEVFDIDSVLSTALIKSATNTYGGRSELFKARLVLFSDNRHSFFQPGTNIRVLDLKNEKIVTKTISELLEGDEIAFLSAKGTVFDELVEFYEHKPEIVNLIKMSELWRTALITYCNENNLNQDQLKVYLDRAGVERHPATINNWLAGGTIGPTENNYTPIDKIARMTNNKELNTHLREVKDATRKIHALRIKIGRYLAKKITQSYISPESIIDDPVLRDKLDEMSSQVRIARVSKISDEEVMVPFDVINKLMATDNI